MNRKCVNKNGRKTVRFIKKVRISFAIMYLSFNYFPQSFKA